jgi:hypothetical protein
LETVENMKRTIPGRSLAIRLLAVMALPFLLYSIYLLAIRPAAVRWGATQEEVARPMPGDDLVLSPSFCATRGITIHSRPEEIWPWLVQIGYDLIENLGSDMGIRSARSILPELQRPGTGDVLPISAAASLVFGSIQPDRYLVWISAGDAETRYVHSEPSMMRCWNTASTSSKAPALINSVAGLQKSEPSISSRAA